MVTIDELIAQSMRAETKEFDYKVYKHHLLLQPASQWYFSWFGEDDLLVQQTSVLQQDAIRMLVMSVGFIFRKADDPLATILLECKTLPEDLAEIYETRHPVLLRQAKYWKERHENPSYPKARARALRAAFPDPRAAYDHFEKVEGRRQRAALALREVFSKLAGSSSVAAPLCRPLALTPAQVSDAGDAVLAYRRKQLENAYSISL